MGRWEGQMGTGDEVPPGHVVLKSQNVSVTLQ